MTRVAALLLFTLSSLQTQWSTWSPLLTNLLSSDLNWRRKNVCCDPDVHDANPFWKKDCRRRGSYHPRTVLPSLLLLSSSSTIENRTASTITFSLFLFSNQHAALLPQWIKFAQPRRQSCPTVLLALNILSTLSTIQTISSIYHTSSDKVYTR